MNIVVTKNYNEMSCHAARLIADQIISKKDPLRRRWGFLDNLGDKGVFFQFYLSSLFLSSF